MVKDVLTFFKHSKSQVTNQCSDVCILPDKTELYLQNTKKYENTTIMPLPGFLIFTFLFIYNERVWTLGDVNESTYLTWNCNISLDSLKLKG